jgi:P27 family predicted phage terminase small subunit
MARFEKKIAVELIQGSGWRADKHAARVDAAGVPGVEHDSVLWNQLAQWQARFDEAAADVEANGSTMDSKGQVVQNPACKVMKDASSEIRELCKVLGIGALNRARLGAGGGDEAEDDAAGAPTRKRA